jgi:hypothetical protein
MLADCPLSSRTQKIKDRLNRKEAESKIPAPAGGIGTGQRVLSETFCINRLEEIRRMAGNAKLRDFINSTLPDNNYLEVTQVFRRFLRENSAGNPPYFCVSAAILGRLVHNFKEEYITKDKEWRISVEFDFHVDEVVDQAKESMSKDATATRMRNQSLIDKQRRLIADAHAQCEMARMKEASLAYGEALNQQLKTLQESTITEDTLNEEMVHASQSNRDRIQRMTAIPPFVMDEDRLQLQIRCAVAEEKAENLQQELCAIQETDAKEKAESSLQKELEDLRKKHAKVTERYSRQSKVNKDVMKESLTLHCDNAALEAKIGKVSSDYNKLKRAAQNG